MKRLAVLLLLAAAPAFAAANDDDQSRSRHTFAAPAPLSAARDRVQKGNPAPPVFRRRRPPRPAPGIGSR